MSIDFLPMSNHGGCSIFITDSFSGLPVESSVPESNAIYIPSSSKDLWDLSARLNSRLEELNRRPSSSGAQMTSLRPSFPPRPPRKSCGKLDTPTPSPMVTPPIRPRRRVSDSSCPRIVEPTRRGPRKKESIDLVFSPLSNGVPRPNTGRQRKESVFMDGLDEVEENVKEMISFLDVENDSEILTELIQSAAASRKKRRVGKKSSVSRQTIEDYSEPIDRLDEKEDRGYGRLTEEEEKRERILRRNQSDIEMERRVNLRRQRFSDSNIGYGQNIGHVEEKIEARRGNRKLSLGLLIRKLSHRKISGGERKTSGSEARFSVGRLVSGSRRLGSSHQVDSSSWEFLPSWEEDSSSSSSGSPSELRKTHVKEEENRYGKEKHFLRGSKDSLYESEYSSSSNSSLTRQ